LKTLLLAVPVTALLLAGPASALAQDTPVDAAATVETPPAEGDAPVEATKEEAAAGDASDGRAGDPLPISQAQRPLVLPHLTLSPVVAANIYHLDVGAFSQTAVIMGVGASIGLFDMAEVEVSPFTSALSPTFEYGATLGGTFRFLDTEMVARLRMLFTTNGIGISPGVPVRLHATDMVRLDTGLYFNIVTTGFAGTSTDTVVGLSSFGTSPITTAPGIPLELTVNPIDELWIGAGTGFGIGDFGNAGDSIFIPLGLGLGGTIPVDDRPLVDIGTGFGFPLFISTLPGADTIVSEIWQVNIAARANLDLAEMMGE
jgi:hypothetical protein